MNLTANLVSMILKAAAADENELKKTRNTLIGLLDIVGAKTFVNTTADILKNNFHIEGCNDARIPLKKIFAISLEELEEDLAKHRYKLTQDHPISLLSADHKDNIKKLKSLRFSLGGLNLNKDTSTEDLKDRATLVKDYYKELDIHIRKEEEVLFPALEESGMHEHPQNLRDEHKNFRSILEGMIKLLEALISKNTDTLIEEVKKSKEKFILDISNHIFRETYVFYPAAIEYITDADRWKKIKEGFDRIK